MQNIFMPARDLQKSYRIIVDQVKTKRQTVILTTNKKPQAAVVSLEDLNIIQQSKAAQASLDMLKLALDSRKDLKGLPSDLRLKADKILYSND